MKTSQEIEEICKKLKPIIGTEADQLWYMYLSENETTRRKLALDIEILAEKLLKHDALIPQEILLTPPSSKDASGSFLLGDIIYNREYFYPLYLRPDDFIKQIGIFAVTGEGIGTLR